MTKLHLLCALTMSVNIAFKQILSGKHSISNKSEDAVAEVSEPKGPAHSASLPNPHISL